MEIDESWLRPADDCDGLWLQHVPAFEAFLSVCGQWRAVMGMTGVRYLGLDYTAVKAGLELAELHLTRAQWADLRDIEAGACAALNGETA